MPVTDLQIYARYSQHDQAFSERLVQALRTTGADVWLEPDPAPVDGITLKSERELRNRYVYLLVLSPAALASPQIEDETRRVHTLLRRDVTRILLPVLVMPLVETDIWPFLRHVGRVEPADTSPAAREETVAAVLRLLRIGNAAPQSIEPPHELLIQGKALLHQGHYTEAVSLFEQVTRMDPDSVGAWINLGFALGLVGRYDEEIEAYDRALSLDPESTTAWNEKGLAFGRAMMYADEWNAYEQALLIDLDFAWTLSNMGGYYGSARRYDKELEMYDRALAVDHLDAGFWTNKGVALRNLNRALESLAAQERALELDPEYDLAWHNKGNTLFSLERYEEAIAAFHRALELNPARLNSRAGIGFVQDELDRKRKAQEENRANDE